MKFAWQDYSVMQQKAAVARGFTNFHHAVRGWLEPVLAEDAPVVLHATPAHLFRPRPGRFNVLFGMWEGYDLPPDYRGASFQADLIVVPSRFCQRVWQKAGFRAEVVPLGIEPSIYERQWPRPERPLRFLFLGSPVARKGWHLVPEAWVRAFSGRPELQEVELYIKMVGGPVTVETEKRNPLRVIVDLRDLTQAELAELYGSAHVFVFPSLLEGFGLPALEAMAAGCLLIAPQHTGLAEFVSPETAIVLKRSCLVDIDYATKFRAKIAGAEDLARALRVAWRGWGAPACESRRQRGRALAHTLTWESTARKLREVVENAYREAA